MRNKLNINDSAELAREEERISKKKAKGNTFSMLTVQYNINVGMCLRMHAWESRSNPALLRFTIKHYLSSSKD